MQPAVSVRGVTKIFQEGTQQPLRSVNISETSR
jgi:hypothetical protein